MFKYKYRILFILLQEILLSSAITAEEGEEVIIECLLNRSNKPITWTGPDTLTDPLMSSNNFREPGMQWANDFHDIKIEKVSVRHNGMYTCEDESGNKASTNLEVQYFRIEKVSIEPAFATAANRTMNFVCSAYSNPYNKIHKHMNIQYSSFADYVCEKDPHKYMNKCTHTTTWDAAKQDNGKEQTCTFTYKTIEKTQSVKVNFKFPPTVVKIIGNMDVKEGGVLALNCSTDSANPVSSLRWKIGEKKDDLPSEVLQKVFEPIEKDAKFNGKSVTQEVHLNVKNAMNEETVFCCAGDLCDSVTLSIHLPTSEGTKVTAWTSYLFIVFATILMSTKI